MSDIKPAIEALAAARGKEVKYGPSLRHGCNVVLMDRGDGEGLIIYEWDEASLGPWPIEADGFTFGQVLLRSIRTG